MWKFSNFSEQCFFQTIIKNHCTTPNGCLRVSENLNFPNYTHKYFKNTSEKKLIEWYPFSIPNYWSKSVNKFTCYYNLCGWCHVLFASGMLCHRCQEELPKGNQINILNTLSSQFRSGSGHQERRGDKGISCVHFSSFYLIAEATLVVNMINDLGAMVAMRLLVISDAHLVGWPRVASHWCQRHWLSVQKTNFIFSFVIHAIELLVFVEDLANFEVTVSQLQQCTHNKHSVTNSSAGLIFVKIRAKTGRIFSNNPGETKVCDFVVFLRVH